MRISNSPTSSVIVQAALILAPGCGSKAPPTITIPPSPSQACDLPPTFHHTFCPPADCGGNSPVTNVFPFNGLHPDGCRNQDGAAMASAGFDRGFSSCDRGSSDPLYLDFAQVEASSEAQGHELVAKAVTDGSIRCRGVELIGATFTVTDQKQTKFALRISEIGVTDPMAPLPLPTKPSSQADMAFPGAPPQDRPAIVRVSAPPGRHVLYRITPADEPSNSLCTSPPPEANPEKPTPILINQPSSNGGLPVVVTEDLAAYAVIVPGAVYDPDARLVPQSVDPASSSVKGSSHRWFNIACASDGLGQTELSGLASAPITDLSSANARLPALHMFTAKYCSGISATTRGTPIAWRAYQTSTTLVRDHLGQGVIEAAWGPEGATCLAHSRLWMSNKTISLPMALVGSGPFLHASYPMTEDEFLNKLCPDRVPECSDPGTPDTLISYTVNHIDGAPTGGVSAQRAR